MQYLVCGNSLMYKDQMQMPFRRNLLLLALIASTLEATAHAAHKSRLSQLPDGILSGNTYSNVALEMRYDIPGGWTATPANAHLKLDDRQPDAPVNQCTKVLLSLHVPEKEKGQFNSTITLFAIDLGCFPGAKFPKSLKDKKQVHEFARKIVNFFAHTPYISSNGADIDAGDMAGRIGIWLTGADVINAPDAQATDGQAAKEPVRVNKLLALVESNGYWFAWANLADDATKAELQKRNDLQFAVKP
jgi:hypothetical protein